MPPFWEADGEGFALTAPRGWAMRHGRKQRIAVRRRGLGGEGGCGRAVFSSSVGTCFGRAGRRLREPKDARHGGRQALRMTSAAISREHCGWTHADLESLWVGSVTEEEEEEEEEREEDWRGARWERAEEQERKALSAETELQVSELPELKLAGGCSSSTSRATCDKKLVVTEQSAEGSTCASVDGESWEDVEEGEAAEEEGEVRASILGERLARCAPVSTSRRRAARWEEARAKAEILAVAWLQEHQKREKARCENRGEWERTLTKFQKEFLGRHGQAIQQQLQPVWGEVGFRARQLPRELSSSFLTHMGEEEVVPVVHGTKASNIPNILRRGLQIPGRDNTLRVVHGSAYGNGIYTAPVQNATLSCRYCCYKRRMLICALLDSPVKLPPSARHEDPEGRTVQGGGGALVVFDARRVLPLFEAFAKELEPRPAPVATTTIKAARRIGEERSWRPAETKVGSSMSKRTCAGGKKRTVTNTVYRIGRRGWLVKRRELTQEPHGEVSGTRRFLLRRAARKRCSKGPAALQPPAQKYEC